MKRTGDTTASRGWGFASSKALWALALAAATLCADDEVTGKELPKRFVKDEITIWTSPLRKSSYDSRAVKKYLIPFSIITATLIATDRHTADALPNSTDQTRWSGRFSQGGAWYSLAGASAGTLLIGQFGGNPKARETGWLAFEALGHAQVATFAIKQITNRGRPLDNDQRGGFWRGGTSFPSGHSAGAFAVATIFAYEYRDKPIVPITAYSLASLVAISRVGARRHWLSDVFAGGSLGFMMGRFTYKRHHPGQGQPTLKTALTPEVGFSPYGPALNWTFGR